MTGAPNTAAGIPTGISHRQATARTAPSLFIFRYAAHMAAASPPQTSRVSSLIPRVFTRAAASPAFMTLP